MSPTTKNKHTQNELGDCGLVRIYITRGSTTNKNNSIFSKYHLTFKKSNKSAFFNSLYNLDTTLDIQTPKLRRCHLDPQKYT